MDELGILGDGAAAAQGGVVYDPALDRFDVAVRAVARACRLGRRDVARDLGLSPRQRSAVLDAVAELDKPLRTEAGVFALLRRCPFVLDAAMVLLVRYQAKGATSRSYYYATQASRTRKAA